LKKDTNKLHLDSNHLNYKINRQKGYKDMKKQLPMIVKFEVKENMIEFVKVNLLKLLEPSRNDKGCILYELHQDMEDHRIFMFYEIWETEALWKAHDSTPHVIEFKNATKDSIDKISYNKLNIL